MNYEALLKSHDWTFEYSEDHSVWQRGSAELAVLQNLQKQLDPDFAIWNRHAPSDFQKKGATDKIPCARAGDGNARERFEAYFLDSRKSKGAGRAPSFERFPDDTYKDDHTQRHWWTWQQALQCLVSDGPRAPAYHLSVDEQEAMRRALRASVKIVGEETPKCAAEGDTLTEGDRLRIEHLAFMAWARPKGFRLDRTTSPGCVSYADNVTAVAWGAWLARATSAARANVQPKGTAVADKPGTRFIEKTNREYIAWCATHYIHEALDERGMKSLDGLWAWQEQERRYAAVQSPAVTPELKHIAAVAHYGGLDGVSEWAALNTIRRLTLPWFPSSASTSEAKALVRAAMASQPPVQPMGDAP